MSLSLENVAPCMHVLGQAARAWGVGRRVRSAIPWELRNMQVRFFQGTFHFDYWANYIENECNDY